jgi:RHH-type rel operon transcriptional repressor/antitoxin RelB
MTTPQTMTRIPSPLSRRLDSVAKRTGRSKAYYVKKAIENYLEDMEDYLRAVAAEEKARERRPFDVVAKRLGLES